MKNFLIVFIVLFSFGEVAQARELAGSLNFRTFRARAIRQIALHRMKACLGIHIFQTRPDLPVVDSYRRLVKSLYAVTISNTRGRL
jgi:hypothetical protein